MPGRGLWAAGAFGVRALTQAAALELREQRIQVTLLVVDATIDRTGGDDASSADPGSLADAVAYLASQSPRAMTHELQVTPALDRWVPEAPGTTTGTRLGARPRDTLRGMTQETGGRAAAT